MKKVLKVGSLFAGVGGICHGFIMGNHRVMWANEWDPKARQTYGLNHTSVPNLLGDDVMELNPEDFERVDVITAGFPCQAFSIAGKMRGFKDPRGNYFFKVANFLEVLEPPVVLLENVKNLIKHDQGKTFKVILDTLSSLGYYIRYKVLNTMDFDIPQNRERVFIVGFKDIREAIRFRFPGGKSNKTNANSVQDFLEPVVDSKYYYEPSWVHYKQLEEASQMHPLAVYQWRRKYVRVNKSGVCPTLTANMGTGGHNVPIIKDKVGIRKLTPRECFNLQGFPSYFQLPDIADCHLYKQAGNAVTVRVSAEIAKALANALV